MRTLRPVGLVCAGPVSRTALERLPRLREQLGSVKAASFRLASRYVNRLGAGAPVRTYSELQESSLILINVPDSNVSEVVHDLTTAHICWLGKQVALYESTFDTAVLYPLRDRGAAPITFNAIGGYERDELLLECSGEAVLAIKKSLLGLFASTVVVA